MGANCTSYWHGKVSITEKTLTSIFSKWGYFVSSHPLCAILSSLIIGLSLTFFNVFIVNETATKELYAPKGTQSWINDDKYEKTWNKYQDHVDANDMVVYSKNDGNENIFTLNALLELYEIHQQIMSITIEDNNKKYKFDDLCYQNANNKCKISSVLEFFDFNLTQLYSFKFGKNRTTIYDVANGSFIRYPTHYSEYSGSYEFALLLFGKTVQFEYIDISPLYFYNYDVGNFEYAPNTGFTSFILAIVTETPAFHVAYSIDSTINDPKLSELWALEFIDFCEKQNEKEDASLKIVYRTTNSFGWEMQKAIASDTNSFIVSFALIGIFSSIILLRFKKANQNNSQNDDALKSIGLCAICCPKCSSICKRCCGSVFKCKFDPSRSRSIMSVFGILSSVLAILATFGLVGGILRVKFNAIVSIAPFLLVGLGVDDMFVLLRSYELTNPNLDIDDRIAKTMERGGVSILFTSLTDLIAFCVGYTSRFGSVSAFCVYCGVGVFVDFAFQITFFLGFMVYDSRIQSHGSLRRRPNVRSDVDQMIKTIDLEYRESNIYKNEMQKQNADTNVEIQALSSIQIQMNAANPIEEHTSAQSDHSTEIVYHKKTSISRDQSNETGDLGRLNAISTNESIDAHSTEIVYNKKTSVSLDHSNETGDLGRLSAITTNESINDNGNTNDDANKAGLVMKEMEKLQSNSGLITERLSGVLADAFPIMELKLKTKISWHKSRATIGFTNLDTMIHPKSASILMESLGHLLLKNLFVKLLVLGVFVIYLTFAIIGVYKVKAFQDLQDLIPTDSYLANYFNDYEKYFDSLGMPVMFVFDKSLDYSDPTVQYAISQFETDIINDDCLTSDPTYVSSWLTSYLLYLSEGFNKTDDHFYGTLFDEYLLSGSGEQYVDDIWNTLVASNYSNTSLFDHDNVINGSRMFALAKPMGVGTGEVKYCLANYKALTQKYVRELGVYYWFEIAVYAEADLITVEQTMYSMVYACLAAMIMTFILIPYPQMPFFVMSTVGQILLGVIGFCSWWGLPINTATMINIIMAVGFAVDNASHFCHSYMIAPITEISYKLSGKLITRNDERNARVLFALNSVGMPILAGDVSTCLALLPLAFAKSALFLAFWKSLSLVMIFGASYSVVYLPVVLSMIGPVGEFGDDVANIRVLTLKSEHSGAIKYPTTPTVNSINIDPEFPETDGGDDGNGDDHDINIELAAALPVSPAPDVDVDDDNEMLALEVLKILKPSAGNTTHINASANATFRDSQIDMIMMSDVFKED